MRSERSEAEVIEDRGVHVVMRDGVKLVADVWRPATETPVPVLLMRTPYGRHLQAPLVAPRRLAAAGFAVVVQDCRGRFDSAGEWVYVHCEVDDGYDTVEWAAGQPWSTGKVGMFGHSYMGNVQWLAAQAAPPHLTALEPECCSADYWEGSFDPGGTFRLALRVGWTMIVIAGMADRWGIDDDYLDQIRAADLATRAAKIAGDPDDLRERLREELVLLDRTYRRRPMRDNPSWYGKATWLDEAFQHEARSDSTWRRRNPSTYYGDVDLPALHVGGWYDIHLVATLRHFTEMRRQAPTARAREAQRMIIGPWAHWTPHLSTVGDVDFGADAAFDLTDLRIQWFDHWLGEGPDTTLPPVRLFVMGENVWRDEYEWPLARTEYTPWYLHADGVLDPAPPGTDCPPDEYTYDPRDPVPTLGGKLLLGTTDVPGPVDQRPLLDRADVLCYTSASLNEPIELTGPVTVDLWAGTDAPDTDFTATLIDVHPDGTALNLCEGAVRARHSGTPMPLRPGAVYRFTIDLAATSVLIPAGHRLRVHISSSSYPEWEPNPNTGNPLGTDTEDQLRPAKQAIYHDANHPSRIILPVIPRHR